MGIRLTLEDVERAAETVSRQLRPTPLRPSLAAGDLDLRLKLECWQPTGSFKVRGATHLLSTLSQAERRRGVVAASAGNHALGVAFAAARLGDVKATLFVPTTAPRAKLDKLRRFAVEVRETGETYDDAVEAARAFERAHGAVFVHAFEDARTAAGQGTLAFEILAECEAPAAVLVHMHPPGGFDRTNWPADFIGSLVDSGVRSSVRKKPGSTSIVRMPNGATSGVSDSIQPSTPNFDAA